MLGDLVTGNNSLQQAMLQKLDLVMLCTDNNRNLLGKDDDSFHMCLPVDCPSVLYIPYWGKNHS